MGFYKNVLRNFATLIKVGREVGNITEIGTDIHRYENYIDEEVLVINVHFSHITLSLNL